MMKKYSLYMLPLLVIVALMISCESGEKVNSVHATQNSNDGISVSWQGLKNPKDLISYNIYWSKDSSFPETITSKGSIQAAIGDDAIVKTYKSDYSFSTGKLEPGEWHVRIRALYNRTYNNLGGSNTVEEEGPGSEITTVVIK